MEWVRSFIKNWKHMRATDPVYKCAVYLDKENGSCSHVDGYLCDMETCNILSDYLADQQEQNR